ncbi:MAG: biotin--[acetyl-CoA-carboxylase] ligase [Bdellovibrionales bacterium]|nr:biotin--[acetyl-CoA-carboxylase] ligase [Bdellovibrionales bacterium]
MITIDEQETEVLRNSLRDTLPEVLCSAYVFPSVGSTMEVSKNLLESEADHLGEVLIVIAREQTHGRGRQQREWVTTEGSLALTVALPTELGPERFSGFSLVVGCSVLSSLRKRADSFQLKWPNDILDQRGEKVGGILIEFVRLHGANFVLIGIGLNLAHAPEHIEGAAGLRSGESPLEVAPRLLASLYRDFQLFREFGFGHFRSQWVSRAAFLGERVKVSLSEKREEIGVFEGVDPSGALVVSNHSGTFTYHSVEQLRLLVASPTTKSL